jgi:hypothetical protein
MAAQVNSQRWHGSRWSGPGPDLEASRAAGSALVVGLTLGYGLALPLGLIVVACLLAVFPVLLGRDPLILPLTEPGSLVYVPLPTALALCGGVVWRATAGAAIGLLTGVLLIVLLREARHPGSRAWTR